MSVNEGSMQSKRLMQISPPLEPKTDRKMPFSSARVDACARQRTFAMLVALWRPPGHAAARTPAVLLPPALRKPWLRKGAPSLSPTRTSEVSSPNPTLGPSGRFWPHGATSTIHALVAHPAGRQEWQVALA